MSKADGMNYAPSGKPNPVCRKGDFVFAAVGLDHGHIYGMCNGLMEAGGELKWVFDEDEEKVRAFERTYPSVQVARSLQEILQDPGVRLVASAKVPADRASLGIEVMRHGKDYFVDKPPLTTLEQLTEVRRVVAETGRKYAVYYSERLHVESAVFAGQLIQDGAIGRVVQVIGMGPHRIGTIGGRPAWFFDSDRYGGILCDIGSHQVEQFLFYTGCDDAWVTFSRVANYRYKKYPKFQDFGDCALTAANGATGYFRVDWFTPDGLGSWGDGRTFILGTHGFIELRKYIDIGRESSGDHVYLVNDEGEFHIPVSGRVGYPFFGELILDCLERTERAMTQEHALKAAELAVIAQRQAVSLGG